VKIEEVRSKKDDELRYELEKAKKELFDARFRVASETSANPMRIRILRRSIARLITVLLERTSGARSPAQPAHARRTAVGAAKGR
jgi:large subunit ribosomal protein L29